MSTGNDKLLDDYLAGDSELSRRYREEGARDVPPAEIDNRLRAEARREVRSGLRRVGLLPAAWTRPLAAAAVVVLAMGVVLQLVREDDHVVFDEDESTLTNESRRTAGEAQSPAPAEGAATPESEEPKTLKFEHRVEPPAEQAPSRAPTGQAPVNKAPEQRSSGAAPERTLGDTAGPQGPTSRDDPQAWVDHIRRLAEQGRLEAAQYYLARYYDRFPGRPVPQDLLNMLNQGGTAEPQ